MKHIRKYILISTAVLLPFLVLGQKTEIAPVETNQEREIADLNKEVTADIKIISKKVNGGIFLRWAPTKSDIWLDGIEHGYIIEKLDVENSTEEKVVYKALTPQPIKPWPLDDWKPIVNDEKPYVAAAAMCIYGEDKDRENRQGFVQQANDLENRFGFSLLSADLDKDAALASGLGFIDALSDEESVFTVYRIRLAGSTLSGYTEQALHRGSISEKKKKSPSISNVIEQENRITLEWSTKGYTEKPSGYYIEKALAESTFERVNELPYLDISTNIMTDQHLVIYNDTVDQNYVEYQYRIIGLDAFGDELLPSDTIVARGIDQSPPSVPQQFTSELIEKDIVALNWSWEDYNGHKDLAGFKIVKSTKEDGEYLPLHENLLPSDTRKFLDNTPDQRATNFYKVIAVDTNGNESTSNISFLITVDEVPPRPPVNLSAEIDTLGRVLLQWDAPNDDDIRGYLVHYAHSREGNFSVIPGDHLPFTHYVDSLDLNTLTETIYYYVVAVDYSYNPSERSVILEVKKPDLIPPAPSIFTDYKVSEEGIYFEWARSTSDDVTSITLERKDKTHDWHQVSDFDSGDKMYLDTEVAGGVLYQYRLVTTDDDGNRTHSQSPLSLEALTTFYIKSVENLKIEKEDNTVLISWSYSVPQDYRFSIFKKSKEGKVKLIKVLTAGDTSYTIPIPAQGSSYSIMVKGKDGRESKLSEYVTYD